MEFVNTIVTQMHAGIPDILIATIVLHRGESHQAFFIQIDQQRIVICDGYVQP